MTGRLSRRRRLRSHLFVLLGLALALCLSPAASFGQDSTSLENLRPGERADLDERVPVNFVFVGYDRDDVATEGFLSGLPREYKPVVRSRLPYTESVEESLLGLDYTYDYRTYYANDRYESRVFRYLSSIAEPAPLTEYQLLYNGNDEEFCDPPDEDPETPVPCQKNGVRNVRNNHYIDARSVERWLAENAPTGVDTQRNTVFFINWWGDGAQPRSGFKHHVYTKTDEPDPDTRFDFGELDSRKLIGWGGTTAEDEESGLGFTSRVWFHDLSAGPDSFTDNWNVDDPDLTGDGVNDYRLPPVWEYFAPDGYRDESELTDDLSKVSRYVAIDLLFTSSPLYPPEFTPRLLPKRINLDVNTVEGIPRVNASRRYQTPELVVEEVDELHRLPYSIDQQDLAYEGKARECYLEFVTFVYSEGEAGEVCYERYQNYSPEANQFLYGAVNLEKLLDRDRRRTYQAALLNWAVRDGENFETSPPALGFADENYRDGTQSFVFSFVSPAIAEAGYGLSTTEIHEYGHHLNLSHPFDGFDYETETEFGWDGEFYFTGVGNEVNSMMSYVDLNWDFSQFDRDNTDRFQAAAYINNANALAEEILASDGATRAANELAEADAAYGEAKAALAEHDYATTFESAKRAYEAALSGAREAGVTVEASNEGRTAVPAARASSQIPGEYIDKPEVGERVEPSEEPSIQSLSPPEPEAYTPLAHRFRR
jgi:hypothetical protein